MEQSLVKQLDAPVAEFDLVTIPGAGRQEKYLFNYLLRHHREYLVQRDEERDSSQIRFNSSHYLFYSRLYLFRFRRILREERI